MEEESVRERDGEDRVGSKGEGEGERRGGKDKKGKVGGRKRQGIG